MADVALQTGGAIPKLAIRLIDKRRQAIIDGVLHFLTPLRVPGLAAVVGGWVLTIAICGAVDGGPMETWSSPQSFVPPALGLTWPVATYEAESGRLSGTAVIVGSADGSDRSVGDLAGEASHRQAVLLTTAGDSVSWITEAAQQGANALVLRYSIPDAAGGGGATGTVELSSPPRWRRSFRE